MVNESFNTYITERDRIDPLSADQLRFLRTVKNVFAKKKSIEYNDFFDLPFTNLGDATSLFSDNELHEIADHFNQIRI